MSWHSSLRKRSKRSLPKTQDRLEIARRLHDGLAQDLAALGYNLDAVIADTELSRSHRLELRRLRFEISRIIDEFRDEIFILRISTRSELQEEIRSILSGWRVSLDLSYPPLRPEMEHALGQTLLEIARNAARHSEGEQFEITTAIRQESFMLIATDNGAGGASMRDRSFGLSSITEYLSTIDARVSCQSDSSGTSYEIEAPLTSIAT